MKSKNLSLLKHDGINYTIPFILLTSLFFMWGLANNMTDTLLAAFRRIMSLTDFQTSWIQIAFYGSYFCLAIPAALFIKRFSFKAGILLGLGMFIFGALLFYPASLTQMYGHFLAALFILAGGLSVLETTANSYVIVMGSPETATRRLNFAQAFNPIGSISGVILSKIFILSHLNQATEQERMAMSPQELEIIQQTELSAVMGPYVGVALILVVLWILIFSVAMPKAFDSEKGTPFGATMLRLLKNPNYRWGVIAQFFYVGAQIGVWSFTIRYVMYELAVNEAEASEFYLAALILFTVCRFIFATIMKYFRAGTLLSISAMLAIIATLGAIVGSDHIGVIALVSISGFMSLMFPTIFGLTVQGLGNDTKIGGAGLIMAILGGAVLTALQGIVSDQTGSIKLSFFVPVICFVVILIYGLKMNRVKAE
ncbi:MAG TPA: L-fucose:H+ symporter permease [Bacteroidales bacterium]|nr:L-fucose:H+ symporter permease [Bacteroidales bacterium]